MKRDMKASNYVTNLTLNLSVAVIFLMRAHIQGVRAGPALRGKVDLCTEEGRY